MGLFDKIFGKTKTDSTPPNLEQAVILHFQYGMDNLEPLHKLERELEEIINEKKVGEYDGQEIATDYSDGFLYMYGSNAEILFNAIQPSLEKTYFIKGAIAKLRFGPPQDGVKEIKIKINE